MSCMLVLQWTSTSFGEQVIDCFALLHQCLSASLDAILDESKDRHSDTEDSGRRQKLLNKSTALNTAYAQAAFELRVGRLRGEKL